MSKHELLTPETAVRNSVYQEVTRDFRVTLRASKRVLGDKHAFTTACLHASTFPTDRMSLRMVWDQFEAIPFAQRFEIVQYLRSRLR